MQYRTLVVCASATALAGVLACSDNPAAPVAPTPAQSGATGAAADGSTLKATPPTPTSPVNNQQLESLVLTATKSTAPYTGSTPLSYIFEIRNAANNVVCASDLVGGGSGESVSYTPTCTLEFDQPHTWRVQAAFGDGRGPWSAAASFRSASGGYIRDNEVFDPLTNGKTVGEIIGPVTFIPGVGVRLETYFSHIRYRLPRPLTMGEFSLIITNVATNTEGGKTKVFAMSEGLADIVTNERRFTVEKRGDPEGIVAWRLISHEDQIDTEGAEREFVAFNPSLPYLWTATWNGFFNVRIQQGGASGPTVYSKGKGYEGLYDPDPHYAFIGAPVGRSGPDAATVPGMIVSKVWISSRPRPAGL